MLQLVKLGKNIMTNSKKEQGDILFSVNNNE